MERMACDKLSSIETLDHFEYSDRKFLHNVDTFYYSVVIADDSSKSTIFDSLLFDLSKLKEIVQDQKQNIEFKHGLMLTTRRFSIYEYCLSMPDLFDIFIANYLPNDRTPRIVLQLRSYALWLNGEAETINSSFEVLDNVLKEYSLVVETTKENRVDWAFHTNYIQEPYTFFNDKKLKYGMLTNLDWYDKRGHISRPKDWDCNDMSLDYFALGQRKSNNIFVRIYNKTREVIEEGYKAFFFSVWRNAGLISFYDQYCYEFAYTKKSYNSLDEARLRFYLDFGVDEQQKKEVELTLKNKKVTYLDIKALADLLTPKVTLIMNIEFQTMRKFYYSSRKQINSLPTLNRVAFELEPLHRILDNRKLFLDYLTLHTLNFVDKEGNTKAWWTRLRSLKMNCFKLGDEKLIREYSNTLDKKLMQKKLINIVATNALYNGKKDSNFIEDISDLLCHLNDNDYKNGVERDTTFEIVTNHGEILSHLGSYALSGYDLYKEKKYPILKNRIPQND